MQSTTSTKTPSVGQYWPEQGGIYAGIIRNPESNQCWHLIMHPDAISPAEWGGYGSKAEGANSYHDGLANTRAMLDSEHDHPVLKQIINLTADDHQDFYLPAQRELNVLCANLPDLCEPVYHWSSTQCDAYGAWTQDFEYGDQGIDGKDLSRAARAVRRLPI